MTHYQSLDELKDLLKKEEIEFYHAIEPSIETLNDNQVEEIRIRFAGRKSPLQDFLKSIRSLDGDKRKEAGALINELKNVIEKKLNDFLNKYREYIENKKLNDAVIDITLPLPKSFIGSRHPISIVMNDLLKPFIRMGFCVVDGPQIDSDFYNFEALNIPKDHPSRDMQDTFFISADKLLRTHTSNVQIHALKERGLPLRIVCPGVVYRNEYDLTHLPTFHQIESLVVDKGIHMGHLRHVINEMLSATFGRSVKTRFRSSYFPFTEPSAEVDIQCQQCSGDGCRTCKFSGWLELGGCGIINKKVLINCDIDPKIYSGFAFGFGLERFAMSRFGIADLRSLIHGVLC